MQVPMAEGNSRNIKSQAQPQESVWDTRIRASTSLPKATSCGFWVSISTKVMGISGKNSGIKMWQQGIPRSPSPMTGKVQKFRSMADRETCWKIKTLITATMCDPAFAGDLVAEVPLKQGLVPVPAALAAGTEQEHCGPGLQGTAPH